MGRMIRVAELRWAEPIGGVERLLLSLGAYSDHSAFEQAFIFLGQGGPYAEAMRAMGCQVQVIDARSGWDPQMRVKLVRCLREFRPDIVDEHGVPPLVRPLVRATTGATLLSFDHGEADINRNKGKPWLNWLIGLERRWFARYVVVNSPANQRLAQRVYRLPPAKLRVVWLGVDLHQFGAQPLERTPGNPDEPVLGYVGRIQNYDKGTDYLPLIARQLRDNGLPAFRLQVVGDGPDLAALRVEVSRLQLEKHFEFLGTRTDVAALMGCMDILIVPSRSEAFGLVAAEALAAGARVVAFDVGGLGEWLAECPDARLVPAGRVPALADSILELWRRFGKQRAQSGRQFVARHFDVRRTVADLEQLYREVAA